MARSGLLGGVWQHVAACFSPLAAITAVVFLLTLTFEAHARCCPTNRLERLSTSSRFPEDRPSLAQLSFDWE